MGLFTMLLFFICGDIMLLNESEAALLLFLPEAIKKGILPNMDKVPATKKAAMTPSFFCSVKRTIGSSG